jgi:hypothetical protein
MPRSASPSADPMLDPVDADWLRRRSAAMPLGLGVVGLLGSVLLLGLLFGPLGLRAAIDLWRSGTRRFAVIVGGGVSAAAIVASVVVAMLWGSLLASVLLGRDAMRLAERWRGREVLAASIPGRSAEGEAADLALARGGTPAVLVFIDVLIDPASDLAATALAHASEAAAAAGARLAVAAPRATATDLDAWIGVEGGLGGVAWRGDAATRWPEPLDAVAAFPTTVVIDGTGRIAGALVGVHPVEDLRRLIELAGSSPSGDKANAGLGGAPESP